jgi:hypothetical protein
MKNMEMLYKGNRKNIAHDKKNARRKISYSGNQLRKIRKLKSLISLRQT